MTALLFLSFANSTNSESCSFANYPEGAKAKSTVQKSVKLNLLGEKLQQESQCTHPIMYLQLFHDTERPLHIFQLPTVDLPSCTVDEPEDTQKTPERSE